MIRSSRVALHGLAWAVALMLGACGGSDSDDSPAPPPASTEIPTTPLQDWPAIKSAVKREDAVETQVEALLAKMSLAEKVGQMTQVEIQGVTPADIKTYHIGSVLNGGGSFPGQHKDAPVADWLALADSLWAASVDPGNANPIPLIWGTDAVHGHNNVKGATLFPHNIGLGATRDPDLLRRIGEVTAREVARTGIDWAFGPTLAVVRDDRWGRTYEGYSEDPLVVQSYGGEVIKGLQGQLAKDAKANEKVVATAKHFLGDGGTTNGKDQGNTEVSEQELIRLHAQGYVPAINAGTMTIMASFNSWNGQKMHGNKSLLTDVLKGKMGFDGFIVGDWNGHGQVDGCTPTNCAQAANAGLDMYMAPDSWKGLYDNLLAQAKSGEVPMARIDDAVRRILRVKAKLGLFQTARPWEGRENVVGNADHRAVAREAVAKSLVLLKNNGVLPIKASAKVLVAGSGADDIGQQSGGWTLSWQGTDNKNSDFPNAQSIYSGFKEAVEASGGSATLSVDGSFSDKPDVAVVVFGETPYAEGVGDLKTLEYQPGDKTDLALLKKLKAAGVPVVAVFLSGRPLWVNPEINASDAFVAAWLPGSEGGGIADVLVGDKAGKARRDFNGKLSFSWPKTAAQTSLNKGDKNYAPLFAYGYGLSYAKPGKVAKLSEVSGVTAIAANDSNYFVGGKTPAPFEFRLLPTTSVHIKPIDAGNVQEAGRQLTFGGGVPAAAEIAADKAFDLTFQTNAEIALQVTYRVDAAPSAKTTLGIGAGKLDVTSVLSGAKVGEWTSLKVPLKCFQSAGTDVTKVEAPFSLATAGSLTVSISGVKLTTDPTGTTCPAKAD